MFRVSVLVALLAVCHDVQAEPARPNPTVPASSFSSTTAFFATPPASLGVPHDFTAGPFFATDFLRAFFPGFGPTQTSVEPQPLITDAVVSGIPVCSHTQR
jgi:sphingomyelin phosphodiesterase